MAYYSFLHRKVYFILYFIIHLFVLQTVGREFYKSFEPLGVWMERPLCFDPRGEEHVPLDSNQWPRHNLYQFETDPKETATLSTCQQNTRHL